MIQLPKGAQILIYPMMNCTISAGFKNAKYSTDPKHEFIHYGTDFDSLTNIDFDVIASGTGKVLAIEQNLNSLGCIVVVQYDNVYIPEFKKVMPLIFRYMHMKDICVSKGILLEAYQKIGTVSGNHKWWDHLHIEVDTDTNNPFHTPQVAESSSHVLIRNSANDFTIINPIFVMAIGEKQTCKIHPNAIYVTKQDSPKYNQCDFTNKSNLRIGQKLILPINKCYVTASKGTLAYRQRFKIEHYGADMTSSIGERTVYASGDGEVLCVGNDSVFGNVVVIKYANVFNHVTKKTQNIIIRYFHLDNIFCKQKDKVNKDTRIALYGSTGKYSTGKHLHLSADYDCKYFNYEAGILTNGTLIKKGNSTTMFNPFEVLHCKLSFPDNQMITGDLVSRYNGKLYVNKEDLMVPTI